MAQQVNTQLEVMTTKQAAEFLQLRESRIKTAIFRREIPFSKVGKLVRFRRSDLEKWLEERTVYPRRDAERMV